MIDAAPSKVTSRVKNLRDNWALRDIENRKIRAVRAGEWQKLAAGIFTEDYPAPMVANLVDQMARDMAAALSTMPSINCNSPSTVKDAPKKFAAKRGKIANGYVHSSELPRRMTDAGDNYDSYGMMVLRTLPDLEAHAPRIRVVDSTGVYAVLGPDGRTQYACEEYEISRLELEEIYSDRNLDVILKNNWSSGNKDKVKVTVYADRDRVVEYLPEVGDYQLYNRASAVPDRCEYVCVPRPTGTGSSLKGIPRGAYADLLYPQLAEHQFKMLLMEAAYKSIQAPTAVPLDVTELPYGPDAVIHTSNPQGIQKVRLDVNPAVLTAIQSLKDDIRVGGGSPAVRSGNIDASIITGKGVEALQSGWSSQVHNAQTAIGWGLQQAIEQCFMMDEHLWPNRKKTIRGVDQGVPYSEDYTPSKDINGDYTVDVSYGFLSGMAPNNALVFVLQAQAAGLISDDFAARQLPVGMNVDEEFRKRDVEQLRKAALQSIEALAQAIPQMVMAQQDPSQIVRSIAEVTKRIQKGEALEDVVSEVLAPQPPPAAQQQPPGSGAPPAGAPGSGGGGGGPQPPGQPGAGPAPQLDQNGRPTLNMLFAGTNSGGNAVINGGVSSQTAARGR